MFWIGFVLFFYDHIRANFIKRSSRLVVVAFSLNITASARTPEHLVEHSGSDITVQERLLFLCTANFTSGFSQFGLQSRLPKSELSSYQTFLCGILAPFHRCYTITTHFPSTQLHKADMMVRGMVQKASSDGARTNASLCKSSISGSVSRSNARKNLS